VVLPAAKLLKKSTPLIPQNQIPLAKKVYHLKMTMPTNIDADTEKRKEASDEEGPPVKKRMISQSELSASQGSAKKAVLEKDKPLVKKRMISQLELSASQRQRSAEKPVIILDEPPVKKRMISQLELSASQKQRSAEKPVIILDEPPVKKRMISQPGPSALGSAGKFVLNNPGKPQSTSSQIRYDWLIQILMIRTYSRYFPHIHI
jgi:hypothetical protein